MLLGGMHRNNRSTRRQLRLFEPIIACKHGGVADSRACSGMSDNAAVKVHRVHGNLLDDLGTTFLIIHVVWIGFCFDKEILVIYYLRPRVS